MSVTGAPHLQICHLNTPMSLALCPGPSPTSGGTPPRTGSPQSRDTQREPVPGLQGTEPCSPVTCWSDALECGRNQKQICSVLDLDSGPVQNSGGTNASPGPWSLGLCPASAAAETSGKYGAEASTRSPASAARCPGVTARGGCRYAPFSLDPELFVTDRPMSRNHFPSLKLRPHN